MNLLAGLKLFCVSTLLTAVFPPLAHALDRTVLIGYAAPMSGVSAAAGPALVQAAEIAIDDLNLQAIHLKGDRLVFKLLVQDDRSDPRTGLLVAQYFVKSEVIGVIGHWNSGVGIPASRIYSEAGLVQIAQGTTAHSYTQQGFSTAYRIVPHDDVSASYTADYVTHEMKARRIAVIDDGTPFGGGFAKQFMDSAKAMQADIVSQFSISNHTSDFNAILRAIQENKPEVVVFGGVDIQGAQLVREMRRFNLDMPLIGASGTVAPQFLEQAGAAGNGTIVLEPGQPSYQGPQWQHFQKIYKSHLSGAMSSYAPFSYDAVQVFAEAIRKANSLDRQAIAVSMRQIRHNGLTGRIGFDAEGNLLNPVYTIFQMRNQQWVPLKTISSKN